MRFKKIIILLVISLGVIVSMGGILLSNDWLYNDCMVTFNTRILDSNGFVAMAPISFTGSTQLVLPPDSHAKLVVLYELREVNPKCGYTIPSMMGSLYNSLSDKNNFPYISPPANGVHAYLTAEQNISGDKVKATYQFDTNSSAVRGSYNMYLVMTCPQFVLTIGDKLNENATGTGCSSHF